MDKCLIALSNRESWVGKAGRQVQFEDGPRRRSAFLLHCWILACGSRPPRGGRGLKPSICARITPCVASPSARGVGWNGRETGAHAGRGHPFECRYISPGRRSSCGDRRPWLGRRVKYACLWRPNISLAAMHRRSSPHRTREHERDSRDRTRPPRHQARRPAVEVKRYRGVTPDGMRAGQARHGSRRLSRHAYGGPFAHDSGRAVVADQRGQNHRP